MSYIVLARHYRPKNFAEMVGQDHVVRALSNALQNQRLHHAYLFTGTRGVGKTTVSRILAKSLNCIGPDGQGGITNEPCGVCQPCRDIDSGRFVDYIELDAASNRGVDEISQLLEQAVYKPVAGRFKVFMIDEVHMLSNTAFNAMLKTLEEPPEYLKFVLATTDPQKVPVTVLSRCLQFNLRSMAPETISEHLGQVLSKENVQFDATSLRLISRAARGSMRDALSLTDQAIAYGSGAIEEAGVRQMLGSIDQSHIYQLIQALAQGQGHLVVDMINQMRMQSLPAKAALEEMVNVLQRMAILRVAPMTAVADDPEDAQIAALIPLLAPDEVQLLYSIVLHGQDELGLASDEYSAMVMILLRMLAFKPAQEANKETPHAPTLTSSAEKKTELASHTHLSTATSTVTATQQPQKEAGLSESAEKPLVTTAAEASPLPEVAITPETVPSTSLASVQDDDVPPWVSESIPDMLDEEPVKRSESMSENFSSRGDFADAPSSLSPKDLEPLETKIPFTSSTETLAPKIDPNSVTKKTPLVELPAPTAHAQRWEVVAQQLIEKNLVIALTRELVLNAQITNLSADEGRWEFICDKQILISEANQKKMSDAMQTLLGHSIELSFIFTEVNDTLALRQKALAEQKMQEAHAAAASDPDVQKWLQTYSGALIIPGATQPIGDAS